MAKRDYYEVLSVERTATVADIKKSYRKLALELHPDRNPGDATAEEKFKEASEAYAVLSDAEKRATYDQFGHAGLSGRGGPGVGDMGDIFSQFSDIFADMFGGASPFGNRRARRAGPERGSDLRIGVRLSFKEAVLGLKKDLELKHPAPCGECDGTGAEGGKRITCVRCQGTGQITHSRGFMMLQTSCPNCQGMGSTIEKACGKCQGSGHVEIERTVKVTFPAGIDDGQTLRVQEQGLAGRLGGPPGHLYVEVHVATDPRFTREGYDLIHEASVSFPKAALGGEIEVTLVDDSVVKVEIPAGTQPGEHVVARGKGVAHLNGKGHGDLIVVVQVQVPKRLNSKTKKLLKELEETLRD